MPEPTTTSTIDTAPNGCDGSLQLALWPTAMSTSETSATFDQPTSKATRNATSSPALAFGRLRSDGPDGLTTEASGPDPAHASLSARQAAAQGLVTTDIYGRRGSGSSASARLSRLLASKYQDRTARLGSMLYRLTWSHKATPAGRWLSAQRASVRRTSDTDCIGLLVDTNLTAAGWPTPKVSDCNGLRPIETSSHQGGGPRANLNDMAMRAAGWPTPTAKDADSSGNRKDQPSCISLTDAARKVGWATPHESDHRPGHASRMYDTSRINLNDQSMLAGWPTPNTVDANSGTRNGKGQQQLCHIVRGAGWATPANRDYRTPNHRTYADRGGGPKGEQLQNQVAHLIPGASLNGSRAATGSCGLLNPDFSLWLQGVPATWRSCAPPATRSARKSRHTSSPLGSNATGASE